MSVKFIGDGGWNYSRILANNIGEGGGVKFEHASNLHPVKRRFLVFFCLYTKQRIAWKIFVSYLPLFKKPILNYTDY